MNFINAMDRIPQLIEQHQARGEKLATDLPILQQSVSGVWKREDELKELKSKVAALERKIALSLNRQQTESNQTCLNCRGATEEGAAKPVDQTDQSQEDKQSQGQATNDDSSNTISHIPSPQNDDKVAGARMRM